MQKHLFIAPPLLKPNDKVVIVSVSSVCDKKRLKRGVEILKRDFGLQVVLSEPVLAKYYNFAGTDEQRLESFQQMLDNPEIKAIIACRGGYGASRIMDRVDWTSFKEDPKWIVGFSDVTAVHQSIQSIGYQSIHGPMVVTLGNDEHSDVALKKALFGDTLIYEEKGHKRNRIGEAKGAMIGGNLCLLAHSIGSKSDINFDGKILFLEEIGEYYYNIDRMLLQLFRAGKLDKLAGLIIGQFSNSKQNDTKFGKKAFEIVEEHVRKFDYPVCYNFPIGHETENRTIRCGEIMKLKVSKENVKLNSL